MKQTVLTLSLEVQPRSVETLRRTIIDLKTQLERQATPGSGMDAYKLFGDTVPALHFMSMMIFEDERYDPVLTIELNFDGAAKDFLPRVEVDLLQPHMRQMLRLCKKPQGPRGALYDAVTAENSQAPLAPYLETCIVRPAVFHQGNRGLDRNRILAEEALFISAQKALEEPALYQETRATEIHAKLRGALIGEHGWLAEPEPERWTQAERIEDVLKFAGFVWVVLFCLAVPGMVLALLIGPCYAAIFSLIGAVLVATGFYKDLKELLFPKAGSVKPAPQLPVVPPEPLETRLLKAGFVVGTLAAYVVLSAFLWSLFLTPFRHAPFGAVFHGSFWVFVAGLVSIVLPIALLIFWIRWQEVRDSIHEDPKDDEERIRRIMALEDQIAQNHMGSVVLIKPGILRSTLLHAGLWGLGLFLRATQTSGYLASMRTIHFAHWAILSNGGRLAFFSNFDSSWESYLDDFIEKAHAGLTLAWTNGIGFPATRFLVFDGATNGRLFKAWARHSMAEGLFWYSAYKDLSVNQIERNYRIARGLRKPSLTDAEAAEWARDL